MFTTLKTTKNHLKRHPEDRDEFFVQSKTDLLNFNSFTVLAGTPAISLPSSANSAVITEPIPTIERAGIELPGAMRISEPM